VRLEVAALVDNGNTVKAAIAPASVSGAAAARRVKATAASPAPICSTCRRPVIADHAA